MMIIDDAWAPVNYYILTLGYEGIPRYFPGGSPDNGAAVGSCLLSHHLLEISL